MYLSIDGIDKSFTNEKNEKVKVLDHINIEIEKGSFVSIVGPSGCGKSTLLYLIAGLEKPDQGEILISGKKVDKSGSGSRCCFSRSWIVSVADSNGERYLRIIVKKNVERTSGGKSTKNFKNGSS